MPSELLVMQQSRADTDTHTQSKRSNKTNPPHKQIRHINLLTLPPIMHEEISLRSALMGYDAATLTLKEKLKVKLS